MKIYIKNFHDEKFPLTVESSDTILKVKEKIRVREGIPVHQQVLLFGFFLNHLCDDKTLADYNIQENSTLELMPRMMAD